MSVQQVVITGASRGIGRSIAETFLTQGWRVWALMRNDASLAGLKERGDARFVPFDATDEASVLRAAEQVKAEAGTVDALVNNAGIGFSSPLHKTSGADFQKVLHVNAFAPFLLMRELGSAMAKAGRGRIVNITSTAGKKGFKYTAAYCASKHALMGLTRALAVELAGKGVTVNSVSPGWTETDLLTETTSRITATTGRSEAQAREALAQMNALNRVVQPSEVAELVHFLCASPAGASITNSDFAIDAGEL